MAIVASLLLIVLLNWLFMGHIVNLGSNYAIQDSDEHLRIKGLRKSPFFCRRVADASLTDFVDFDDQIGSTLESGNSDEAINSAWDKFEIEASVIVVIQ